MLLKRQIWVARQSLGQKCNCNKSTRRIFKVGWRKNDENPTTFLFLFLPHLQFFLVDRPRFCGHLLPCLNFHWSHRDWFANVLCSFKVKSAVVEIFLCTRLLLHRVWTTTWGTHLWLKSWTCGRVSSTVGARECSHHISLGATTSFTRTKVASFLQQWQWKTRDSVSCSLLKWVLTTCLGKMTGPKQFAEDREQTVANVLVTQQQTVEPSRQV